jgi:hypothetical protein
LYFFGIYELLGESANSISAKFCGIFKQLCYYGEELTLTEDATLDYIDRFLVLMSHT